MSWTRETWDLGKETAFTLYFSLSSGRKVTCFQVGKSTQTTWGKYINSLSSSEDSSKYCWLGFFFLSQKALLYAHYICRASLSPPETLIGRYPASLLLSPPNQFSLQHLCTCSEYKPLKMDVMRVCLIALRERKLCVPHFQRGGMPSEEGRGVSVDHSRATVYGKPAILAGFL